MSATANLLVPEATGLEDELEMASFLSADSLESPPPFVEAARMEACEAIVSHYESRLNAADGVILHLGAGRGELMETLRQHGFAVMGCEPSPRPTRLARETHGFDARTLHCSSVENFLHWMGRIGCKAQAIFFRHQWEHNLELQALLPRMADILLDEGCVISLLPPPMGDYPREAHLSFLHELATACTSSSTSFEIGSFHRDAEDEFMAFTLRKVAVPETRLVAANQC